MKTSGVFCCVVGAGLAFASGFFEKPEPILSYAFLLLCVGVVFLMNTEES